MKNRTITLNGTEFTLGKDYTDSRTGCKGKAVAGAVYLTGCDQLLLLSVDSTGRPFSEWVDVTCIESVKIEKPTKGGPAPNIPQRAPSGRM